MLMRLSNLHSKISAISIMILIFFVLIASSNALLVRFFGKPLLNKSLYPWLDLSRNSNWFYIITLSLSMYSSQSLNVIHDELNKRF